MFLLLFAVLLLSPITLHAADFIKGADISWVTGQELSGILFQDTLGKQRDVVDILKNDYRLNTIRLRVFVKPSTDWGDGLCDIPATVAMAKRVKSAGMQVMLTLHYSDSWADPSKQTTPATWSGYTIAQLDTAVFNYTKKVMNALSAEGIYPVLVQIGNETNDGMLWPNGKASGNMANYARFVTAGNNAVKEVSPETKTVVHLSNGFDNALFRWNIGGLISNGAKFDVIGMSAYPEYAPNTTVNDWLAFNNKIVANVNDMIATYNKPVVIAETGMDYRSEDNCMKMIADMISKLRSVKNSKGLGILYWEPQAGPGYNRGYNLGAWGANNRPTRALKGFIESPITATDYLIKQVSLQKQGVSIGVLFGKDNYTSIRDSRARIELYQISGRLLYKGNFSKEVTECINSGTYLLRKDAIGK